MQLHLFLVREDQMQIATINSHLAISSQGQVFRTYIDLLFQN